MFTLNLEIKLRNWEQSFVNVALKVQTSFVKSVIILTNILYITRILIPRSFIVGCRSCFIVRFDLVTKKDCIGVWKKIYKFFIVNLTNISTTFQKTKEKIFLWLLQFNKIQLRNECKIFTNLDFRRRS